MTTVTNERPHHLQIAVSPEDVDLMGRANNALCLNTVHDAGFAYWRHDTSQQAVKFLLWGAPRFAIRYLRLIRIVREVVEGFVQSLRALRETSVVQVSAERLGPIERLFEKLHRYDGNELGL